MTNEELFFELTTRAGSLQKEVNDLASTVCVIVPRTLKLDLQSKQRAAVTSSTGNQQAFFTSMQTESSSQFIEGKVEIPSCKKI